MRDYNGRCAQCGLWNCHHLYTTSNTANGPQTERSGVPNPEPDGLVTVELTRAELDAVLAPFRGLKATSQDAIRETRNATDKLFTARASLERTGK